MSFQTMHEGMGWGPALLAVGQSMRGGACLQKGLRNCSTNTTGESEPCLAATTGCVWEHDALPGACLESGRGEGGVEGKHLQQHRPTVDEETGC